MGLERVKDALVPVFGELAIGIWHRFPRASSIGTGCEIVSFAATAQRQETIMLNWAIAFL
jgi:hypothetical protein